MRASVFVPFLFVAACAVGQERTMEGFIGDAGSAWDADRGEDGAPGEGAGGEGGGAGGSGGESGAAGAGGTGGAGGGAGGSGGAGGAAGAGGSGGEGGGAGGSGGEGGAGGAGGSGGEGGGAGGSGGEGGAAGAGGSGGAGGDPDPPGPVEPGVYTYERVVSYGVVNPPAAAWHPSGSYALVLNASDKVYRYDRATNALSEVGAGGTGVAWRAVTFTPDGERAVLLGNTTSEGRIYRWEHASGTLSEMSAERHAGGTYEAIAYAPDGSEARLLGSTKSGSSGYIAYLWPFDAATGRDKASVKATTTGSGGVQDMAWATDDYDNPAIVIVGGIGGVTMMHLDGNGDWIKPSTAGLGNTPRIGGRPQGDYALAMGATTNISPIRVFKQGKWTQASVSINYPRQIAFSTDGRRALLLASNTGNLIWEYRHELLSTSQFTTVSIPNFSQPPYNASSNARLHDVAWRPGCDEGLIVGGISSYSEQQGFVIRFTVDNGKQCQD